MSVTRTFTATRGARISDEQADRYGRFLHRHAGLGKRPVDAATIVTLAEPTDSPLHDAFEWNDGRAAHEYRCVQARDLVRSIMVVEHRGSTDVPTRAFHHVVDPSTGQDGYVAQRVVWQSRDYASQVTARAFRELRSWRERYAQYEQLAGLVAKVDDAIEATAA